VRFVPTKGLAAALLLAVITRPAAPQCLGDCDGDSDVTVAEIVGAVNRALGQCESGPTPTPVGDRCPFRFDDDTEDMWCVYAGSIRDRPPQFNPACLAVTRIAWKSNGTQISLRIRTPRVHLTGPVTNAELATVDRWGLRAEAVALPIVGVAEIEAGFSITTYFPDPQFVADEGTDDACPVGFIDADFLDVRPEAEVFD
jgi:hypothetical protein